MFWDSSLGLIAFYFAQLKLLLQFYSFLFFYYFLEWRNKIFAESKNKSIQKNMFSSSPKAGTFVDPNIVWEDAWKVKGKKPSAAVVLDWKQMTRIEKRSACNFGRPRPPPALLHDSRIAYLSFYIPAPIYQNTFWLILGKKELGYFGNPKGYLCPVDCHLWFYQALNGQKKYVDKNLSQKYNSC